MRLLCLAVFALGCAATPARATGLLEPGEELIERGGDLALAAPPAATVAIEGDRLVAWAQTEVPGDSRLQAALAMADALVRSELGKAVRTKVVAVDRASQSASGQGEAQSASTLSAETIAALLDKLPLPQHAWLKLRRDGEIILRLYARLSVERSWLQAMLAQGGGK